MSHRDQILKRLEEAGQRGVHSFQLLDITPRYAARICELNKLGYNVSSVPEMGAEAMGCRYTLNVGVDAGKGRSESRGASIHSGVERFSSPSSAPPGSSMYDPFEEWAA